MSDAPFKVGTQLEDEEEMKVVIDTYNGKNNYLCDYRKFTPDNKYPEYILYRWCCQCHGKLSKKGTGIRTCVSLKCDCKYKIASGNPFITGTKKRDPVKVEVISCDLVHTGGCTGCQETGSCPWRTVLLLGTPICSGSDKLINL
jgi:hypothetical protein